MKFLCEQSRGRHARPPAQTRPGPFRRVPLRARPPAHTCAPTPRPRPGIPGWLRRPRGPGGGRTGAARGSGPGREATRRGAPASPRRPGQRCLPAAERAHSAPQRPLPGHARPRRGSETSRAAAAPRSPFRLPEPWPEGGERPGPPPTRGPERAAGGGGSRGRRRGRPRPRPRRKSARARWPSGGARAARGGAWAGPRGVAPPPPRPRRSAVAVTTGAAATAAGARVRRRLPAVPPKPAAAARPRRSPRLPARGEGTARPPPSALRPPARRRVSGARAAPPARRPPAAVRARAASGRDYAKMVLQARSKHREAAPKPPQPPRASPSPLRGAQDAGAGEPGPERAPRSPGRKGAAGRKGPRAEPAAPSAGGGLGGRLAAGLRGALGLRRAGRGRTWTTLLLAAFAAVLHWSHITHLFENDRHFSHLSTLEREMAFRTEMGLYYSYFKTIVEAPSFLNGVWMIMNDKLTEYPLVINTLKRFNLYPEVILASWYRIYTKIMDLIGLQTKICWTVTRGEGLSPIESCEGMGDPACFYVAVIFILNGLMMALFFIYGTYLSGSRLGGLVTVLCFFFNHGECTRVMWTPPLRESFSYPFLVLQMLLVTHILRATKLYRGSLIALCISNVFFMLPWQFAQFVLLTQIASLFAVYVVGYIDICKLRKIIYIHMISLALCFVLMFGNSMLLTSYYASSLVIIWVILEMKPHFLKINVSELSLWVIQGCFWLFGTVVLKYLTSKIFGIADDAHIGNLLTSKFFSYKDFDTLLYTCAAEFDFMEKETPLRYTKTLLLPVVLVVFIAIVKKIISDMWGVLTKQQTHIRKHQFDHGELVYHALQLLAYTVLGILIMRLKLFLTPHMCVMASLICSRQLFGWLFCKVHPGAVVFAVLAAMSIQGSANLQTQWNIVGEFSNLPQEELIEWIKYSTKPDAVFAGAMPTMASVKLSALRPIVNHPHYEDAGLRARTKIVYSMYSRKAAEEVKRELIKLQVNYYILEESWCIRRSKPGCSMPEIWDVEDPANAGKPPLCNLLVKDSKPHFTTVFQNSVYKVLEVIEE